MGVWNLKFTEIALKIRESKENDSSDLLVCLKIYNEQTEI